MDMSRHNLSSIQDKISLVVSDIEAKLDEDLKKLDDEDFAAESGRALLESKKNTARQEYLSNGHGGYEEIDEKEFYSIAKKSMNMVAHFYKDEIPRCKIFDHHLKILAEKHVEARFVKLLADKCLDIAATYNINDIPSLLIIKDGEVKEKIVGFSDLGNCDNFSTNMLEWRLGVAWAYPR